MQRRGSGVGHTENENYHPTVLVLITPQKFDGGNVYRLEVLSSRGVFTVLESVIT
jgi:hypothetical protein